MRVFVPPIAPIRDELKAIGRQAPFALSLGLNNLGLAAQSSVRREIGRQFTLRGTQKFFDRGVLFKRGNKRKPNAVLTIGAERGTKGTATTRASQILARHEEGGERSSTEVVKAGRKLVPAGFFLPGPGLRTASKNVPRRLYPSAIGATIRFDGREPGVAYYANPRKVKGRGKRQVVDSFFVIPRVGIFQRQSGGLGSKVRPIWFFKSRVRTPARTRFEETARDVISDQFARHIREAIAQALRTAR